MAMPNPLPPLELLQELFEERDGILYQRRNVTAARGEHSWHIVAKAGDLAGRLNSDGYWHVGVKGYGPFVRSRVIWKLHHCTDPLGVIDHINGIKDDDRIENLRDVPHGVNSRNKLGRDGSSYVIFNEHSRLYSQTVNFNIMCWPDEDHEQLTAELHRLIAPEIDAIYANRLGRQRPTAALEAAE
jgi:hypothetical protein